MLSSPGMAVLVSGDRIVRRHGVSWAEYERVLARRGERRGPRITYLEGELELLSPGFDHESIASLIGHLLESYCLDRDIELMPLGSWTIKRKQVLRGAEADECYVFGVRKVRPKRPDLAIEVAWSRGGIDKLEVWRKLGVREVWIWRRERLQAFRLRGETYHEVSSSRFVPELDLQLLVRFLDRPTLNQAIRDFRAALGRKA